MMGVPTHNANSFPNDAGDFKRCLKLLWEIPEWRVRLKEVVDQYPEWGPIVDVWDDVTYEVCCAEENNTKGCPSQAVVHINNANNILKPAVQQAQNIQCENRRKQKYHTAFHKWFDGACCELEDGPKELAYSINNIQHSVVICVDNRDEVINFFNTSLRFTEVCNTSGTSIPNFVINFTQPVTI